eukprot:COSAG05_NODE_832_length_7073_cov_4.937482_1_plen_1070_part_10
MEEAPPAPALAPAFRLPKLLKRDLRAMAPARIYSDAEKLGAENLAMVGCTLFGRVQGKNVLVQSGQNGDIVGKCSICRVWNSPLLGPLASAPENVPPVALDEDAASVGGDDDDLKPGGKNRVRGLHMCSHTIALLLRFLRDKPLVVGTAKPELFEQVRSLGQEKLIKLFSVVAGRNPALLGRLQSYIDLVTQGEDLSGLHDPSAPLSLGPAAANSGQELNGQSARSASEPEPSIFQRDLAQALRESLLRQGIQSKKGAPQRSSARTLIGARFDDIKAVEAPSLAATVWSGGSNPLQRLVPLSCEVFTACRIAGLTDWTACGDLELHKTVLQMEHYVAQRLLHWAWKPVAATSVDSQRPAASSITFEVSNAQRCAWLAAVEKTPSQFLWDTLVNLHRPIQTRAIKNRASIDAMDDAISPDVPSGCVPAKLDPARFAQLLSGGQGLFGLQLSLLRRWKNYAEAFGLCHAKRSPIDALLVLLEAGVRYYLSAQNAADSESTVDILGRNRHANDAMQLLEQCVEYVKENRDAVRKQCKNSDEARVLFLLEIMEIMSPIHCYRACVVGERYALAADCLLRVGGPKGTALLAELLVAHPEMLRNPQDSARYTRALYQKVSEAEVTGTDNKEEQRASDQPSDASAGKLLQVYAAAATGLSRHDDYWGGRGHIDQPAWSLVLRLAAAGRSALLDQHARQVLHLFVRTCNSEKQFHSKLATLRAIVFPGAERWKTVAQPALRNAAASIPRAELGQLGLSAEQWVELLLAAEEGQIAVEAIGSTSLQMLSVVLMSPHKPGPKQLQQMVPRATLEMMVWHAFLAIISPGPDSAKVDYATVADAQKAATEQVAQLRALVFSAVESPGAQEQLWRKLDCLGDLAVLVAAPAGHSFETTCNEQMRDEAFPAAQVRPQLQEPATHDSMVIKQLLNVKSLWGAEKMEVVFNAVLAASGRGSGTAAGQEPQLLRSRFRAALAVTRKANRSRATVAAKSNRFETAAAIVTGSGDETKSGISRGSVGGARTVSGTPFATAAVSQDSVNSQPSKLENEEAHTKRKFSTASVDDATSTANSYKSGRSDGTT